MKGRVWKAVTLVGLVVTLVIGAASPAFAHVWHGAYVYDALTFDPLSDAQVWIRVHNYQTPQWSDWELCGVVDANLYGHSFDWDEEDIDEWQVLIVEEDLGEYNGYTPINPNSNPVSKPQTVYTFNWYVLETP